MVPSASRDLSKALLIGLSTRRAHAPGRLARADDQARLTAPLCRRQHPPSIMAGRAVCALLWRCRWRPLGYRGVGLQPCYRKHRDGGSMSALHGDVFAISPDIRYVAVAHSQQVHMRSQPDLHNASSSDSDLYEELLVNPALLTLATQRGNIDCGGLRYLVI